MPTMRFRQRITSPMRRAARATRLVAARSARAGALAGALLGLAACTNDAPLSLPVPPDTSKLPQVDHETYPTVGTTPRTGRAPLSEPQRAKLQKDLEQISKERDAKVRSAVSDGN